MTKCLPRCHGEIASTALSDGKFSSGGTDGKEVGSRQLNGPAPLPHPDRDRPLGEACNDLTGRLRPSGQDGEIDEWSVYDESFRQLVRWAEEAGCFFEGLQPLKKGGREHDLTFIEESRTWLKFTKPAAAGYVISFDSGAPALEPALPLEYLERLQLQNGIFADQVSFVGVAGEALPYSICDLQMW